MSAFLDDRKKIAAPTETTTLPAGVNDHRVSLRGQGDGRRLFYTMYFYHNTGTFGIPLQCVHRDNGGQYSRYTYSRWELFWLSILYKIRRCRVLYESHFLLTIVEQMVSPFVRQSDNKLSLNSKSSSSTIRMRDRAD